MSPKTALAGSLAAIALVLCGCSDSKDSMPEVGSRGSAPATQAPPIGSASEAPEVDAAEEERNALFAEYQQIQQRLGTLQRQALEDTLLQASYALLESHIEEAMLTVDPAYSEKRDRFFALQEDMRAARQSGDQEAMLSINEEGTALQAELDELQDKVLEIEEVSAEVEAFRESVGDKMKELDPEADALLKRATEIAEILQAAADAPGSEAPDGE